MQQTLGAVSPWAALNSCGEFGVFLEFVERQNAPVQIVGPADR